MVSYRVIGLPRAHRLDSDSPLSRDWMDLDEGNPAEAFTHVTRPNTARHPGISPLGARAWHTPSGGCERCEQLSLGKGWSDMRYQARSIRRLGAGAQTPSPGIGGTLVSLCRKMKSPCGRHRFSLGSELGNARQDRGTWPSRVKRRNQPPHRPESRYSEGPAYQLRRMVICRIH